jgi:hypothetical protein
MLENCCYNTTMPFVDIRSDIQEVELEDGPADCAFWKTRSYEERMVELENLRQLHYAGRDNVPTRLLGVVKITKRRGC